MQGRGKCYQLSLRPWLITLTKTLISPEITKKTNLIMVLLYIVLKKIRTNTASHGTQFDSALILPTDKSLIC